MTSTAETAKGSRKRAANSNRGSKPGERRGGRQKGTPNKATKDIREFAREYTRQALETLVQIATEGESEAARVSAANAILDRAYGKPSQSIDHQSSDGSMSPKQWTDLFRDAHDPR